MCSVLHTYIARQRLGLQLVQDVRDGSGAALPFPTNFHLGDIIRTRDGIVPQHAHGEAKSSKAVVSAVLTHSTSRFAGCSVIPVTS